MKKPTVAQLEIPEAQIGDFCRRHGIRRLALFGSILTDRFSESSDIDVLVEFRLTSAWATFGSLISKRS